MLCTVSYGIMTAHGGSLSVFSEGEGHGCKFTMKLPLIEKTPVLSSRRSSIFLSIGSNAFVSRRSRSHSVASDRSSEDSVGVDVDVQLEDSLSSSRRNSIFISLRSNAFVSRRSHSRSVASDCSSEGSANVDVGFQLEDSLSSSRRNSIFISLGSNAFVSRRSRSHSVAPDRSIEGSASVDVGVQLEERVKLRTSESTKRVLVVDDAASNRRMLCRMLAGKGYPYEEAQDGQEAVDVIKATIFTADVPSFDVVVLDFEMPRMNGPEAARAMRDLGYKGLIVGLTGHTEKAEINRFISQGADRVLCKPLAFSDLEPLLQL